MKWNELVVVICLSLVFAKGLYAEVNEGDLAIRSAEGNAPAQVAAQPPPPPVFVVLAPAKEVCGYSGKNAAGETIVLDFPFKPVIGDEFIVYVIRKGVLVPLYTEVISSIAISDTGVLEYSCNALFSDRAEATPNLYVYLTKKGLTFYLASSEFLFELTCDPNR